ncbi:MAG: tetratricopeptide repeat protein [Methylobacter sp.]
MKPERLLLAEEEEQWQELSRHVEWAERFSLIVLFVEDALLAENFKQRLQSQLQGRVSKLHVFRPLHSETLTQDIFRELQHALIPHAVVPCWLELHDHRSPEWQKALDNFFARFNERRDLIRRDFPRPFIILLPLAYKSRLREIAPDLWSIRSHTDELRPVKAAPGLHLNHDRIADYKKEQPLEVNERALSSPEIREWERVRHTDIADSELLLVAGHAFDAAFYLGQWSLAETLAQQLIILSHSIIKDKGETASTLRELSLALLCLGRIEEAIGHYEEAYQAYIECLQIRRELQAKLGSTPEILRDLSISLERVADIDKTLGRYEVAFTGYGKSLEVCRKLQVELGNTPEVLQDLSIKLERLAHIDEILGRYEAAFTSYRESLGICLKLQAELGDTPEVLRDLSVSLEKMAGIQAILGRYEVAIRGYTESLEIRRKLQIALGDTPQVLRDLSVSLEKIADIDATLGRYEAALTVYAESLRLRRELQASLGDTPEVLDDLSFSLEKLADCENSLQHRDKAVAAYWECLSLLERLQAVLRYDQYLERIAEIQAKISAL